MRKCDELADAGSCLNKAKSNEILFVLLERDESAADTIRFWVGNRITKGINKIDDPKMVEALVTADEIEAAHKKGTTHEDVR